MTKEHSRQYTVIAGLVLSQVNDFGSTCMPCAGDWRALTKRWVSQGAKSPISTCLLWSLWGTGSTLQNGSLLICAVCSRKLGRSLERSKCAFLDTRNHMTWKERSRSSSWVKQVLHSFKKRAFSDVSPDPPPHQMWRSAHGGRGGSQWRKVSYTLLLGLMEGETPPCRLGPVDKKSI